MTTYDLNAVHVYNKFLWSRLLEAGLMNESDYSGLTPIIPSQQERVFNDMTAGRPFIIYTFAMASYDVDIWANVEQVTYRIFSDDERKLRNISNFIVDLSKRFDWSASDVNSWIKTFNTVDQDEKSFDFKYVQVLSMTGPEPYSEEGGRQSASVTVRISYTIESETKVDGVRMGMRS